MKCAVAVISSRRGRSVRASNRATNHAGTFGLRNETVTSLPLRARTCAFVIGVPQIGDGCGRDVLCDLIQCPLPPSPRRVPVAIADDPPPVSYATRPGASALDVDTT